jgi:hypothetical protein
MPFQVKRAPLIQERIFEGMDKIIVSSAYGVVPCMLGGGNRYNVKNGNVPWHHFIDPES